MKKFTFAASVTISLITEVIAETEEEALEIAQERESIKAYDWGNRTQYLKHWISKEYDGEISDHDLIKEEV
jgi:hypothetical protein